MTKTAPVTLVVEPSTKEMLDRIANKHRVSLGHIVREAIYEYLEKHAPDGLCPKCGSTEIKCYGILDKSSGRTITDAQCGDCGHEWEV